MDWSLYKSRGGKTLDLVDKDYMMVPSLNKKIRELFPVQKKSKNALNSSCPI